MKRKIGLFLMIAGMASVLAALSLFVYNRLEAQRADQNAQEVMDTLAAVIGEMTGGNGRTDMTEVLIDGWYYIGYLSIPSLGLDLPVMTDWSYEQLKIAPCRYSGSTINGGFVIAAHNYENHFGRIRNLSEGDEVYFVDMDGVVWTYRVAVQEVLAPTAVEEMTDAGYDLTLFTCTYGGQSRVTVRCEAVTEETDTAS